MWRESVRAMQTDKARGVRASRRGNEAESKSWKETERLNCGGGKEREKRGHHSHSQICVCVFALLQWPHLPLHPVRRHSPKEEG